MLGAEDKVVAQLLGIFWYVHSDQFSNIRIRDWC
jgi:hypothetical protein